MAYTLEERETTLRFNGMNNTWVYETNVPKHIKTILRNPLYEVLEKEVEDDKVIWLKACINAEHGMSFFPEIKKRKKPVLTAEQRQARSDWMNGLNSHTKTH